MGQAPSTSDTKAHGHLASSFNTNFKTFKLESKVISEETISLIQAHLQKGDFQKTVSIINTALKDLENAPLNIAVTGESGAGKSTFINALRGIGHEEDGAAATGVVETTAERTSYIHPKFPKVTIWDLPGIGTTTFKAETYLHEMKFHEYDFFIIISSTRFRENDAQLAKAIEKMKKNFYFVRTKVDSDLRDQAKCRPKAYDEDEVLQQIRNDCLKNLEKADVGTGRVFLISSVEVAQFDFPELESTLLKELPAHKRYIFMQCLRNVTEATIEWRRDSLKQTIWLEALKRGAAAAIPMMRLFNSKVEELEKTLTFCRVFFGLDDESLENMAQDLSLSVEELKTSIKSPHLLSAEPDESTGDKLMKYLEKIFATTGGLIATGLYFGKSYYLQNYFLDTVVNDAKILLRRRDLFENDVDSQQGCKMERIRQPACDWS
ncbi:T-cell-specific guanine nucleotide triphosphate-binding protein 1-like [Nannospalax galili]|uniref:T-cell-specific guanine nucleotide triphosphate-binding protein 1-like n=1 Tax=Nannospalax galili TaxID=1026970 RepID=UPI0004ED3341|nr:T-cell-specific guanine nucleotide triphosphate-binding protein 1-like [Nannospalax galili]